MVTISCVRTDKQLRAFIKFPEKLYKDHPYWVPPLRMDEMNCLKKTAPAFRHCDAEYFLAYKGDEIVGRVAAIINTVANHDWKENVVRFGWIDFIDDYDVSKALIEAVVEWGKEGGMTYIKGPLGFSDMDKEGLLVEGFENIPSITCIYNYPYYADHLEKMGFVKDVDWTQDIMDIPETLSDKLTRFEEVIKERYGYTVMYPKRNSEYRKRGKEIFDVMNRSFTGLYEYSRLNDEQIQDYVNQYLPFVSRDLVCIILDKNDKIVGFAVTIPSLSKAFRKANGKLFPFGFIHILRALKRNDLLEALLIGVDPEHQGKGLSAVIFNHILRGAKKYGLKKMVMNPRLEENRKVRAIFDEFKPQLFMRRRCYKATLETIEQTISTSSSVM